jgi:hypothetical protein
LFEIFCADFGSLTRISIKTEQAELVGYKQNHRKLKLFETFPNRISLTSSLKMNTRILILLLILCLITVSHCQLNQDKMKEADKERDEMKKKRSKRTTLEKRTRVKTTPSGKAEKAEKNKEKSEASDD